MKYLGYLLVAILITGGLIALMIQVPRWTEPDRTGGTRLIYRVEARNLHDVKERDLRLTARMLEERLDPRGEHGLGVRVWPEGRLAIEVPPDSLDEQTLRERLAHVNEGVTFHIVVAPEEVPTELPDPEAGEAQAEPMPDGLAWFPVAETEEFVNDPAEKEALDADPVAFFAKRDMLARRVGGQCFVLLWTEPRKAMTADDPPNWGVTEVKETVDARALPALRISLNDVGGRAMLRLSGNHIGRPMAIVAGGRILTAPTIQAQLSDLLTITNASGFSRAEIDRLRWTLSGKPLPVRLAAEPDAVETITEDD